VYNATCHTTTKLPPFYVMTGQMPRWIPDVILDNPTHETQVFESDHDYVKSLINNPEKAYDVVRSNLKRSAAYGSDYYNKKVSEASIEPGQRVHVFNPRCLLGKNTKLMSRFCGVGTVVQEFNDCPYLIKCPNWKQAKFIHVDKLKPYYNYPRA
jgi:hypothetical protein